MCESAIRSQRVYTRSAPSARLRVPARADGPEQRSSPFGAVKWSTLPSSLNILTSSTPGIGWTLSFFSAPWSFLSSWAPEGLVFRTIFLRTVPLPPGFEKGRRISRAANFERAKPRAVLTDPVCGRESLQFCQFCGVHGDFGGRMEKPEG